MHNEHLRMEREKKTILAMVYFFCNSHHNSHGELCTDCSDFFEYARMHLDKCPFQEKKPTYARCTIHCYKPDMKEKIKKIMRYSGPRMLWHLPVLALQHGIDGFKRPKKIKVS